MKKETAKKNTKNSIKRSTIILYAIFVIAAGICTGLFLSSMVSADNTAINPDVSMGDDMEKNGGAASEGRTDRANVWADYNITNNQRYYKQLIADSDRNVLIIGEDATSGNFDTIILASVSEKNKTIQLINFPRDIYIDYSDEVLNKLKKKSPALYKAKGFQKINAAHTVGARIEYKDGNGRFGDSNYDFLADLIEEVFGVTIDDYAYVNTKGFREIVDLFGGVEVYVPVRMKYDDPTQNLHIDLQKGTQVLNGKQAEGFVRFRQGYDEKGVFRNYSDQFRKENQNEFLKAFFKQHVSIKNLGKIDELVDLLNENVVTSINSAKKVTTYANLLRKALTGKYTLESSLVECGDPKKINGVYFEIIRSE